MTEKQWNALLDVISGNIPKCLPVGFIIDSPWLPGWAGISTIDYFTSDKLWFEVNLKAIETFPDTIFLPGFWSEYGMLGEPSAFGAPMIWQEDGNYAGKIIDVDDIDGLVKPNPVRDGLLPFMLKRLQHAEADINQRGHFIKFAVSRGPLNIASFLMGTTDFLVALKLEPQKTKKLVGLITDFIVDWLTLQRETFKTIDGIFLLDDILGFIGEDDFQEFALPGLKRIYNAFPAKVKFLHNDANGLITAKYLNDIGVNLFNFSFNHSIPEIQDLTQSKVTLLGNIPPRDVLLNGSHSDVKKAVTQVMQNVNARTRLILSCGGGIPQGVKTENINTMITAVNGLI